MNIIQTKYGKLEGRQEKDWTAFLGIPYAKPPVGGLRWREPEPPEPWEGVKQAFSFGHPALQHNGQEIPGGDPAELAKFGGDSEDCLYLNLWTPAKSPEEKLPVFIWIHGGAFCCGSGAGKSASPAPFCSRGIIYVSFNYRLGIMGYFVHPELSAESPHGVSGNYAHFDQIAALKWVKENIGAFGGDPDNITVGGCSAGCGSTQVLCNSPLSKGLFAKAILESTVSLDGAGYPEDFKLSRMDEMEARGVEYMELLGAKNLEELRQMSYEQLTDPEESKFRRKYHYGTTIGLCEDGYLLPQYYTKGNVAHTNADIPYIVGNTHDENGGFVFFKDMEGFRKRVEPVYEEKTDEYIEMCGGSSAGMEEIRAAMRDSHLLLARSKLFAKRNADAGRRPVYVFDFMRKDPANGQAHHGLETLYLMGVQHAVPGMTEEDDRLACTMQEYWCSFIRTGDPNGAGRPQWPPYSAENRSVLYLDAPEVCVRKDEDAEHPLLTFTREVLEEKLK